MGKRKPARRLKLVRYLGRLEYIPGVPARDMPPREWHALSEEKRRLAVASGLYELVFEEAE